MTLAVPHYAPMLKRLGLPEGTLSDPFTVYETSRSGVLHAREWCRAVRDDRTLLPVEVNALTRRKPCQRCRPRMITWAARPWARAVELLAGVDADVRILEENAVEGQVVALAVTSQQAAAIDQRLAKLRDLGTPGTVLADEEIGEELRDAYVEAIDRIRGRLAKLDDLALASRQARVAALGDTALSAFAADVAWSETADLVERDFGGILLQPLTQACAMWRGTAASDVGYSWELDAPLPSVVSMAAARNAFTLQMNAAPWPTSFSAHDLPGRWTTSADDHVDGISWAAAEWQARRDDALDVVLGSLEATHAAALADAEVPAVVLLNERFPTRRGNDLLLAGQVLARSEQLRRLVVATSRLGARWLLAWSRREGRANATLLASGDDCFGEDVAASFLTLWEETYDGAIYRRDEALHVARSLCA